MNFPELSSSFSKWQQASDSMLNDEEKLPIPERMKFLERYYEASKGIVRLSGQKLFIMEGFVQATMKVNGAEDEAVTTRYFCQLFEDLLLLSEHNPFPNGFRIVHQIIMEDCQVEEGSDPLTFFISIGKSKPIFSLVRKGKETETFATCEFRLDSEDLAAEWVRNMLTMSNAAVRERAQRPRKTIVNITIADEDDEPVEEEVKAEQECADIDNEEDFEELKPAEQMKEDVVEESKEKEIEDKENENKAESREIGSEVLQSEEKSVETKDSGLSFVKLSSSFKFNLKLKGKAKEVSDLESKSAPSSSSVTLPTSSSESQQTIFDDSISKRTEEKTSIEKLPHSETLSVGDAPQEPVSVTAKENVADKESKSPTLEVEKDVLQTVPESSEPLTNPLVEHEPVQLVWYQYQTPDGLDYWYNPSTGESTYIDPYHVWTRHMTNGGTLFWYNKDTKESTYTNPEQSS
jgi:hypothetical protein